MTNEQLIRRNIAEMTTEEFARMIDDLVDLSNVGMIGMDYCDSDENCDCPHPEVACRNCIVRWLRKEAIS